MALKTGHAIVGWAEVDDLSPMSDREALRELLRLTYPEASSALIANWAGQLWRFRSAIAEGDNVVLPLKTNPGFLVIGRATGEYFYDTQAAPGWRHKRPVRWNKPIPRAKLGNDLLDSLGSLLTVCQLARHDASDRVAVVADGGRDPGWKPETATAGDLDDRESFFTRAQDEILSDPLRISIRDLLGLWGASRRTEAAVDVIVSDLADHGLSVTPGISEGWLDNVVEVRRLAATPEQASAAPMLAAEAPPSTSVSIGIDTLQAATDGVISVQRGDSLTKAITLMLRHDYSQLAVVDQQKLLVGAVSWESIGRARLAHATPSLDTATISPRTVFITDGLLGVVGEVSAHGYVFVRDHHSARPIGIVTVADTSVQFETMSRPFALIEETERRLRRRVDEVFTPAELNQAPTKKKHIGGAADLTLGSYVHVLTSAKNYAKLGWDLDQEIFLTCLLRVSKIRNELMHFSTDPLGSTELELLEAFVATLKTVDPRP